MDAVRLDKLFMTEVSGVDDPANQLPGWMVTKSADATAPESIVAKIKGIILGAPTEEGIDMEKDELVTILAESNKSLVTSLSEAVAEAVTKSLTPAEGEGATVVPAVATPEADAPVFTEAQTDAIAKAIEDGFAPYNEIFEKVLDRLEGTEKHLGIAARKSLDGQESGEGEGEPVVKATPDLGDAISAALKRS
jgi:hypothetical protein